MSIEHSLICLMKNIYVVNIRAWDKISNGSHNLISSPHSLAKWTRKWPEELYTLITMWITWDENIKMNIRWLVNHRLTFNRYNSRNSNGQKSTLRLLTFEYCPNFSLKSPRTNWRAKSIVNGWLDDLFNNDCCESNTKFMKMNFKNAVFWKIIIVRSFTFSYKKYWISEITCKNQCNHFLSSNIVYWLTVRNQSTDLINYHYMLLGEIWGECRTLTV